MSTTLADLAAPPPAVDSGPIEVSVVMPCLDEARTVGVCIDKARAALAALGVRGEVIVADNGSSDGSPDVARGHGARVVLVSRKGYGSALQAGIAAARGTFVIMGDADDSYDFGQLGPFLDRLRAGDDLVLGNRFQGGIRPGAMPWHHRYIGNPVLTGLLNLFFRSPVGDAHCGLRGFRRDACRKLGLTSTGMEFASEMIVKACLHRQTISEVPVVLHPDGRGRPPHLRSFRDGWRHLRFLLLMCPLWLFRVPSVVLLGVGLGLMVWLTPGPSRLGGVTLDVHTMLLGALCVVLGYQTLWLWVFARLHAWLAGLMPPDPFLKRVFRRWSLERGLVVGLALMVVGLGCNLRLLGEWWSLRLGPLEVQATLRWALWGFTLMVAGVQTIYGHFILGLVRMAARSRAEE
jgi:hypothetical protein